MFNLKKKIMGRKLADYLKYPKCVFPVNLAPVKFHLMDKLFWARDQKEIAR